LFTNIAKSKWLKIVLFITTFAFVGTGFVALIFYKLSGQISGVAEVNGEEITPQEFYYEVERIQTQYQRQGIDISPIKNLIYSQVLENLIGRELLYQFAKEEGIQATTEEVKQVILGIPAFQKNGKFDKNLFLSYLNSMNISPQLFEIILKKQLSAQHVLDILHAGVYITDYEINTLISKRLSSITGKVAIISPTDVKLSEKELINFYNKNKNLFSTAKGKKIKVYKININELGIEKANKLAQELYKHLKQNESIQIPKGVEIIFNDVYQQGKSDLPQPIVNNINKLSKDKKVLFIKDKSAYYLIVYEKDENIPLSFEKAKPQIEQILKGEKTKEILNKILNEIKDKKPDFENIVKKYNAKVENIKDQKYLNLQFNYNLSPESMEKLMKTKEKSYVPLLSNGKILVFYIEKIKTPKEDEYKKAVKSIKPLLENQKLNDITNMLINKLKDEADIKINNRIFQ